MTINVTNISPTPGTKLATGAALSFDVTTDGEAYVIQIAFGNSSYELAFDGEGYPVPYASSSRQAISGGHSYTIRRSGSWPGVPVLAVRPLASGGVQSEVQGTTVEVGTDGAETVSVGTAATSALDVAGASLAAAVTGNVIVESTGGDATLGADGDVNITASNGAVTITAPDIALTGDVTVNGDPIGGGGGDGDTITDGVASVVCSDSSVTITGDSVTVNGDLVVGSTAGTSRWATLTTTADGVLSMAPGGSATSLVSRIEQAGSGTGKSIELYSGLGASGSASGSYTTGLENGNTVLGGSVRTRLGSNVSGDSDAHIWESHNGTSWAEILRVFLDSGFATIKSGTGMALLLTSPAGLVMNTTGGSLTISGAATLSIGSVSGNTFTGPFVEVAGQLSSDPDDVAYAASVTPNWNNGNTVRVGPLTGNITIANGTNPRDGAIYYVVLTEDGSGGHTRSWGTKYKFGSTSTPNDAAGYESVGAGAVTTYAFMYHAPSDLYLCLFVSAVEL